MNIYIVKNNPISIKMNSNAWVIWNELVKFKENIKYITMEIFTGFLDIEIIFDNNSELFSKKIFEQINHILYINDSTFLLKLQITNESHIINLFEKLYYPPNVNTMIIVINTPFSEAISCVYDCIKLLNLPECLEQLKIISSIPFDLSNLPTGLFLLDISESKCKFNLDYLPNSLKVLYLPELPLIQSNKYQYIYKLTNLSNLPSSLIEINIGTNRNIVWTSIEELIKNFDKINNDFL